MGQEPNKNKLTDAEMDDLRAYIKEMDALAAQEPEHIEDVITPEEYQQAQDYFLKGKGDPPACGDRFTVTEVTALDRDGVKRTHKALLDTVYEDWNNKCSDVTEKHIKAITKALAIYISNAEAGDNLTGVIDIIKSLLPAEQADFYNVPNSPVTDLIYETLSAGADLPALPVRKKYVAHAAKYEITGNETTNKRRVIKSGDDFEMTVEAGDIYKILGSNKAAKKLFVLTLIKANEQAIFNGQLLKDFVTFPLQELVDIGFYKSTRSARRGFNSGSDTLTSLKVKGRGNANKHGATSSAETDALEVLFTGARIMDGQCYIFLNDRINWAFIAQYFTVLPAYYFKLPNNASDLLYYIFYMARQHTKDIAQKGYFTIGFRAIWARLDLPNEKGLNNPQRDIKQPIEDAITQIEDENHKSFHNTEFTLEPHYDDTAPISEFLNKGYLKVSLTGDFAAQFIQLSNQTANKITTAAKRQERIEDQARAINKAKAIQKEKAP